MTKKIPLSEWYAYLEQLLERKTGYIYGTAGVLCTQRTINASIARYPENAEMTRRYGKQWIGHYVTDCSGVPLPIARRYGIRLPHGSSSLVRQGYIVDCGPDPHPGWAALVDPTPDTPDNHHIGYVGADGETIYECRGTKDGFVKSSIHDRRWTKYGRMTFIDYGEDDGDGRETETMPEDGGTRVYYRAEVATEQGKLNVRSGPGTEYGVLFKLARGSVVDVLFEYPSGWDWISDDGDHGYVSHKYLRKVEPSQSAVADSSGIAAVGGVCPAAGGIDGKAIDESPGGGAKGGETASGAETSPDGETSSDAAQGGATFPKGEGDGKGMTLLLCRENNVTIGLMGDWEIIS